MLKYYIIHISHSLIPLSSSLPFHTLPPSPPPFIPHLTVQSSPSPALTSSHFLLLHWLVHSHWCEPYILQTTIHITERRRKREIKIIIINPSPYFSYHPYSSSSNPCYCLFLPSTYSLSIQNATNHHSSSHRCCCYGITFLYCYSHYIQGCCERSTTNSRLPEGCETGTNRVFLNTVFSMSGSLYCALLSATPAFFLSCFGPQAPL